MVTNLTSDDELAATARKCLDALIEQLPGTLRDEARRVGYVLAHRDDSADGQDTLGDYCRPVSRISLYLHALREYCVEEHLEFARQLQITYLHELGHHLGLPEGALEERAL
jgi:hypothetical protein